jgi:hypothetical protein
MVIKIRHQFGESGALMTEVMVAMAILLAAMLPMGDSVINEDKLFRATYQRAIAMEIVDGEMEVLAAGEWRAFPEGTQDYKVQAAAAANLAQGQFRLIRQTNHLRLEWAPTNTHGINPVIREVTLK